MYGERGDMPAAINWEIVCQTIKGVAGVKDANEDTSCVAARVAKSYAPGAGRRGQHHAIATTACTGKKACTKTKAG